MSNLNEVHEQDVNQNRNAITEHHHHKILHPVKEEDTNH